MSPAFPSGMIISPTDPALVSPVAPPTPVVRPGLDGPAFADLLSHSAQANVPAQFSRHALARVQRRGIALDQPTLQRLGDGLSRASSKGARNAVVFVDQTAFVADVPSRTVITAVGAEHMREHVFTNIDSAVIA